MTVVKTSLINADISYEQLWIYGRNSHCSLPLDFGSSKLKAGRWTGLILGVSADTLRVWV